MRRRWDRLQEIWCASMHGQLMWPFRGRYRCRICLREFPVEFASRAEAEPPRPRKPLTAVVEARW